MHIYRTHVKYLTPKYIHLAPLQNIYKLPHETSKKKKKKTTDLPFCPIAPRIIEKPLDKTLKLEKINHSPLSAMCCVSKRL